jgi:hypothetical protein
MDKRIVDTLIKFGLITNVGVDADKYESIDDLIKKGVVTVPGAKSKIMELLGSDITDTVISDIVTEVLVSDEPVIDETPETETVIDEVPVSEPVIDETPETETVIVDDPVDNDVEIVVEDIETPKKTKKSKKNE